TGYIHHIAIVLKTVAKFLGADDAAKRLAVYCHGLRPPRKGLTDKNKRFLHQFADLHKLRALLSLPHRLLREADQGVGSFRSQAVRVAYAVAIGIELSIPLRARNLVDLRLDQHIIRAGDKVLLSVPDTDTKNGVAIEADFPFWLVTLIERY